MLIRHLDQIRGSFRNVRDKGWESARLLLAGDGMGFSFHITTLEAGREWTFEYRHHLEAVYVLQGTGSIEDHATGERHRLVPGTLYALDRHDRHTLRTGTELVTACVFNPPVTGEEVHDETGAYKPAAAREASQ